MSECLLEIARDKRPLGRAPQPREGQWRGPNSNSQAVRYHKLDQANNIGTIWVGVWAGSIGAGNTMVLGGVISVTMTALILWFWKPIREYRSGE